MRSAPPVESQSRGKIMFGNIGKIVSQALTNIKPLDSAIQQEMQAYQQDNNPEHLLKVIGMQQQIIANKANALQGVGQIGSILEGAIKGLQPNTPGPSLPLPAMQAIERMLQGLQAPAAPSERAGASKEDMLRYQQAMQKQTQTFEMMTKALQTQAEMAKSAIQNLR
jgi:hypothetical protein